MVVTLLLLTPTLVNELLALAVETATPEETMPPVDGPPGWTAVRRDAFLDFYRSRLSRTDGSTFFAIMVEDTVAGMIRLASLPTPGEYETGMWLGLPYRGRGIGSTAVRAVVAEARARGAHVVVADTTPGNAAALATLRSGGATLMPSDGKVLARIDVGAAAYAAPMTSVAPVARVRPSETASERQTLEELLDFLRATVVNKVAGLTDEQAFAAAVSPSTLTPAGLVKHLTGVERFWFSIDFAGADLPWPWSDEEPHGNFPIADGDTLASLVEEYTTECARSRAAIAGADLDDLARGEGMAFTLRYALTHMIEETARHCGHLDLLREAIDGQTGE